MTTREETELMCRTGPGTPGGKMMRRYWLPVGLSEELPQGGAPLPVTILSERLVLFRDEAGRVGLLQRGCAHRCADLSFGRIEDGGLRCLYHGWLYDVAGNCLEQPGEPPESTYKNEVKALSYPLVEKGGMIFAYLGRDTPPEFPDWEFLNAPEAHRFHLRTVIECNYLQALEGNIDPVHLSYLHRPLTRVDTRPVPGSTKSADVFYAEERRPRLDLEPTDYGIRIFSVRGADNDKQYLRITNFIMPCSAAIVGNEGRVNEGYAVHWHVPIDDTHNMRFDFVYNRVRPLDKEKYRTRIGNVTGPDGMTRRSLDNRYFQSREAMRTENFTGMGGSFNVHDAFATESMGPISDRTQEHLATSDRIIVRARNQILEAIADVANGKEPRGVIRDPARRDRSHVVVVSEVIPKGVDPKEYWKSRVQKPQAAE
jgi:phenylpropionate dioxygenase-like ring-hydroxylating dioxygenase large terminal subunit